MGQARFVYIMGRGHSGSTALDGLLGNAVDAFGTGELISGLSQADPVCSCGDSLKACSFWGPVRDTLSHEESGEAGRYSEVVARLAAQASVRRFFETLRQGREDRLTRRLIGDNEGLLEAIARQASASCVVDSSKEITRGLFLARFLPRTRIIHLVRHPESTAESLVRRMTSGTGYKFQGRRYYNESLTPIFVAMMSLTWTVGNLLAEVVSWVAPDRVIRIEYETLCEEPVETLTRLCAFLEIDGQAMIESVSRGEPLQMGHKIGGNGMRMKSDFVFSPATTTREDLPEIHRWICRAMTWPLLWRYGYIGRG